MEKHNGTTPVQQDDISAKKELLKQTPWVLG